MNEKVELLRNYCVDKYGVDIIETTDSTDRHVIRLRQICMKILLDQTNMSQKQIGKVFSKDHATVIYARKVINGMIDVDKVFVSNYEDVLSFRFDTRKSISVIINDVDEFERFFKINNPNVKSVSIREGLSYPQNIPVSQVRGSDEWLRISVDEYVGLKKSRSIGVGIILDSLSALEDACLTWRPVSDKIIISITEKQSENKEIMDELEDLRFKALLDFVYVCAGDNNASIQNKNGLVVALENTECAYIHVQKSSHSYKRSELDGAKNAVFLSPIDISCCHLDDEKMSRIVPFMFKAGVRFCEEPHKNDRFSCIDGWNIDRNASFLLSKRIVKMEEKS